MDNIEKFISTALNDVENESKKIDLDISKAARILAEVLKVVMKDLDIAGEIIGIVNPTLASEVIIVAQFAGALDSVFEILENLNSISTSDDPIEKIKQDYDELKIDVDKAIEIWKAQKKLIVKNSAIIEKKAVSFQSPLINSEKELTGGDGI